MVTAELAVVLPVLAGLLVLGIGAVALGVDHIRCVDAARIGARALARADPQERVHTAVRSAAPAGASVAVDGDARTVVVTVAVTRVLPGGLGPFGVAATSRADREVASS